MQSHIMLVQEKYMRLMIFFYIFKGKNEKTPPRNEWTEFKEKPSGLYDLS